LLKYVIWGFVALVLLIVAFVGYGTYWHEYDFKDPQTVASFKEKYNDNCLALYRSRMSKSGKSVGADQLDKIDAACSCVRDGMAEALSKRAAITGAELANLLTTDPELKAISASCSAKAGIEEPL
jgi:hypothetical protein